jgi:hypothetical protein
MIRRAWMLAILWPVAGCMGMGEERPPLVQTNPFHVPPTRTQVALAPASTAAAARVDMLGRKLVEANKQAGVQPLFRTIGAPQPEIFHRGMAEIDITEGLVTQCQSEGALAALLCNELGKMVSEREALAGPGTRIPDREPPHDVPIGNDGGSFGPADRTHLAEQGMFEKSHPRRPDAPPPPPPDPQLLAQTYLAKAGYSQQELAAAAPLLQAAAANAAFEKQMNLTPPPQPLGH